MGPLFQNGFTYVRMVLAKVIENRYSIVLNRRLSHRTRRAWMSSLKAQTYQCCGSAFLCFSSLSPTWSERLILRLIRDPSSCSRYYVRTSRGKGGTISSFLYIKVGNIIINLHVSITQLQKGSI